MHGSELVESVIERISGEGLSFLNHYEPAVPIASEVLDGLRFPSGATLSPALRTWLAYDAGLLGFFEDPHNPVFREQNIEAFARDTFGEGPVATKIATLEKTLPGLCYLLPMGKSAKRFLYVGEPDSVGEPPVLVIDPADPPFVCVEYPGIDVFLADKARFFLKRPREFGGFGFDEVYGPRMQEHRDRLFDGLPSIKYGEDGFAPLIETDLRADETMLLAPHQPVPEGYRVVEEIENPMFGGVMRLVAPIG